MIDRSSEPALADSNTRARGSKWTVLFRSNNLVDNKKNIPNLVS